VANNGAAACSAAPTAGHADLGGLSPDGRASEASEPAASHAEVAAGGHQAGECLLVVRDALGEAEPRSHSGGGGGGRPVAEAAAAAAAAAASATTGPAAAVGA
jgi:hypothetical protein